MKINIRYWIKLSLFNLLIVAFLGAIMRYKIGFEFPYFSQKNIQHAHSHLAFLGWITHTLYVLIIDVLIEKGVQLNLKKYKRLIIFNLICAYAMIISFVVSGYGSVSIVLSSIGIVINYFFSFSLHTDLKKLLKQEYFTNWFKAALLFNVLSSLGTFGLAYIIGTKHFNQHLYLASLYFYLHFQYNGFFSFACIGLLLYKLPDWLPQFVYNSKMFWYFFVACVPAYFLSTLWAGLPMWLYAIVVVAAFVQFFVWLKMLADIVKAVKSKTFEFEKVYYLLLLVAIAFTAKILLQLGSTVPAISKMAFGFRPIVIAYLHLILLAIISVFLVIYMFALNYISYHRFAKRSLYVFVAGVFLNELVLGIQGIASLSYTAVPYVNEILFLVALIILAGIFLMYCFQLKATIT